MSTYSNYLFGLNILFKVGFMILLIHLFRLLKIEMIVSKMFNKFVSFLKKYFRKIYRISLNSTKYSSIVWKELNYLHKKNNWVYGVFEIKKYIETTFEIAPGIRESFFYFLIENQLYYRVTFCNNFPEEMTSQFFILATHFNNILSDGTVLINTEAKYVEFQKKSDMLICVLFPEEILAQLVRHFNTSKDVYWAFNKLLEENEEPAIIIADLLKMNKERKNA